MLEIALVGRSIDASPVDALKHAGLRGPALRVVGAGFIAWKVETLVSVAEEGAFFPDLAARDCNEGLAFVRVGLGRGEGECEQDECGKGAHGCGIVSGHDVEIRARASASNESAFKLSNRSGGQDLLKLRTKLWFLISPWDVAPILQKLRAFEKFGWFARAGLLINAFEGIALFPSH